MDGNGWFAWTSAIGPFAFMPDASMPIAFFSPAL